MPRTILTNCRLLDCTGTAPTPNSEVVIDGGTISAVGPAGQTVTGPDDRVVDMDGWTVMPGLSNLHVHLALNVPMSQKSDPNRPGLLAYRCAWRAAAALHAGVTLVRSPGDPLGLAIDLAAAINDGMMPGPRLFAAGSPIISTGGHGHGGFGSVEADGPYQFRHCAREQIKRGADLIKVIVTGGIGTPGTMVGSGNVKRDELQEAVDIAHQFGKHITIHAGGSEPIRMGVELGVDCVEHGYVFDESVAELMAERGTFLVPTLAVSHGQEWMERSGASEHVVTTSLSAREDHVRSIRSAVAAGVKLCVGTDIPADDLVEGVVATVFEVELLVRVAGLSPMQALQAATLNPATVLGVADKLGTLEPGKLADMVAMPGDPAADITNLRNIGFVMKDGCVIKSELSGR